MKRAVAFRHVSFEDLGTLADTLHALGYECRSIDTPVESFAHLDPQAAQYSPAMAHALSQVISRRLTPLAG